MGKEKDGKMNIGKQLKSLYDENIGIFNDIWKSEKERDAWSNERDVASGYYEVKGKSWYPIEIEGKIKLVGFAGIEAVILIQGSDTPFAIQFSGEPEKFLSDFEDSEIGISLAERGINYTVHGNIMFINLFSTAWIFQGNVVYDKERNTYFSKDKTRLIRVGEDYLKSSLKTESSNYDILEGVMSIGHFAFKDSIVGVVNVPNSIKSIEKGAFVNTNLTSINIPESVTEIGHVAFSYCSKLNSINVASDNPIYKSIDGDLYKKTGNVLMQYAIGKKADKFTVLDSVKYIDDFAFAGCDNLTEIIVSCEDSVFIGNYTFAMCENLKTIKLSDNVLYLGNNVFENCINLEEIVVPNSIRIIRDYTFNGCEKLTTVNLSNEISYIGSGAFKNCKNLSKITIPKNVWNIGALAFSGCDKLKEIYFEGTASQWKKVLIYDISELKQIKVYYYSEKEPSVNKNSYWRYVNGKETIWS